MNTRTVPTPRGIALNRCGTPTPVGPCPATESSPAPAASAGVYDRELWEQALLAADLPHHCARMLGWGLAHLAGPGGYLPPDTTRVAHLVERLRMTGRQVRLSLTQLELAGLIRRPDIHTWTPKEITRPIALTLPPAGTAGGQEPPHTGGADA
ncbi:hypothetical protein [Streptomyces sp. HGB0020]|uniref:DprA-like winged helix domain-containing protein n=1 Tax=Streptomyces sp. HGB0020 TaxID=1078086 RepID=UPI00034E66FC|nr:hypothetical protein [Streptomyces sp. HGB0020]EPD63152.1 hypothetical protein HMPREF1211_03493 [Streptomyces sp. HGB0020]